MYNVLTFIYFDSITWTTKSTINYLKNMPSMKLSWSIMITKLLFSHILNDLHSQWCALATPVLNSRTLIDEEISWETVLHMAEKYVALVKQKYQYSLILYIKKYNWLSNILPPQVYINGEGCNVGTVCKLRVFEMMKHNDWIYVEGLH